MAATIFSNFCVQPNHGALPFSKKQHWLRRSAPYLDSAIGIAIVLIGILGTQGILPFSSSLSSGLIAGGGVYLTMAALPNILFRCKFQSQLRDIYLIKTPQTALPAHT